MQPKFSGREKKPSRAGSDAKKAVNVSARIARLSRKGGTNQEEHPERLFAVFFSFSGLIGEKKDGKRKMGMILYLPWTEVGRVRADGWMTVGCLSLHG